MTYEIKDGNVYFGDIEFNESAIHSLVYYHGVDNIYDELSPIIESYYNDTYMDMESGVTFELSSALKALEEYSDNFVLDKNKVETIQLDSEIKDAEDFEVDI